MSTPQPGWMPGTDRSQIYGGNAHKAKVDKIVLHTTEGSSWPDYINGSVAPHFTVHRGGYASNNVRQHIPTTQSSKALENDSGGVETNNDGCVQIEFIGSCDRSYASQYGLFFTENADDDDLDALAHVVAWIAAAHGVPLTDRGLAWTNTNAATETSPQRMSYDKWRGFSGVCGHIHVPENCVTPDTLILMGDLTWRPAGELRTGDRIVGFDEEPPDRVGRRFTDARATVHGEIVKDSHRVTMEDGRSVIASSDHKWLVRNTRIQHGPRSEWVETQHLDPSKHEILSIGHPWQMRDDYEAGWVAGAIDCDGSVVFDQSAGSMIHFGQEERRVDVMDRFVAYLEAEGIDYWTQERLRWGVGQIEHKMRFFDLHTKGGFWQTVRLLSEVGSSKFAAVSEGCWVGRTIGKGTERAQIGTVEHVGERTLIGLESTTKTYVADGLLCHNSHWDPGKFPIDRLLALAKGQVPDDADHGEGHDDYHLIVDGRFGTATSSALQRYLVKFHGAGIAVDGRMGHDSWAAWQDAVNAPYVDGVISRQSYRATELGNGIVEGSSWEYTGRGSSGSQSIELMQEWAGATVDGILGSGTTSKVQAELNTYDLT